jgi:hypothetical protein
MQLYLYFLIHFLFIVPFSMGKFLLYLQRGIKIAKICSDKIKIFRFQSLKLRGLTWLLRRFALLIRVLSERSRNTTRDSGCNDGGLSCSVSVLSGY